MKKGMFSVGVMVRMGILIAILIIFAITPIGYLKVGLVSISFNMIPVVVGAIVVGPVGGAALGLVFGLTSFAQAFGADPLGAQFLLINPFALFIMCVVPRVLAGWLAGLSFKLLNNTRLPHIAAVPITAFIGSALNTVLFIAALWLLWKDAVPFTNVFGRIGFWPLFLLITGTNAIIEAIVNIVAGAGIGGAVRYFLPVKARR